VTMFVSFLVSTGDSDDEAAQLAITSGICVDGEAVPVVVSDE
jgi:hypothetical protein